MVCQVPLISGHANLRALVRADFIAGFRELFDADRLARFQGKAPVMVPVVDKDPLAASALPTADSWEWFSETGNTRAPAWRNEVTLRSVEMFTEYEPGTYLPYISPTPPLLLVAEGDHLVPSELAIAAFDTAHQPKERVIPARRPLRRLHQGLRGLERPGARLVHAAPVRLAPGAGRLGAGPQPGSW